MNIADLKAGMDNIEIKAEIADMEEPVEVMTKFGTAVELTNVTLRDDTGSIKLVLWGDKSKGLNQGDTILLKNAFVKEFRGEKQLGLPKNGEIEKEG